MLPSFITSNIETKCSILDMPDSEVFKASGGFGAVLNNFYSNNTAVIPRIHVSDSLILPSYGTYFRSLPDEYQLIIGLNTDSLMKLSSSELREICKTIDDCKNISVHLCLGSNMEEEASELLERIKILVSAFERQTTIYIPEELPKPCAKDIQTMCRENHIPYEIGMLSPYQNKYPHRLDSLLSGPCPVAGILKVQDDGLISFCPYRKVENNDAFCIGNLSDNHIKYGRGAF